MTKQFFVGIGAQKAGTSWLADYFIRHPQVAFSPVKELHYFDSMYRKDLCGGFNKIFEKRLKALLMRESFTNLYKFTHSISLEKLEMIRCLSLRLEMMHNPKRYCDYFDTLLEAEQKAYGEITPSYSLLNADGFNAIKNAYNNAKFIFCLRDPVDRYWSHLRSTEKRPLNLLKYNHKKILECLDNPQFRLRTDYERTITQLYTVVPEQDVCIIFYEHLMNGDTHAAELKKITDFLDIDYIAGSITTKINAGNTLPLDDNDAKIIAAEFSHVYQYIEDVVPGPLPERWKQRISLIQ